ncbi:UPF0298 protein [Lentibacillus sp. JNUCC-1]|uniref:YlbG family protein n=1 Tax=Lentibacillus sp. JNUCC-1 TaxID=2654513 RepID=UPI0012E7F992|nr:DUF2129 domain-containing protein [Lentibacillus sp. JNUCC-1]MUV36242.1 UPF0298 protein [Lentibacillus sp. JNUCC-1]
MKERQGLIVWFQQMRNTKYIKRFGHLVHVSKKMKYAVLYVDMEQIDSVEQKLLKQSFISKVDRSYKPFIQTDYENAKVDKAKEYDYKMGI